MKKCFNIFIINFFFFFFLRFASAFPLIIVILVTSIKQAYEDIIRHRADSKVNNQLCKILRNGSFVTVKSKDIKCGDIIQVERDTTFPCDLLFL